MKASRQTFGILVLAILENFIMISQLASLNEGSSTSKEEGPDTTWPIPKTDLDQEKSKCNKLADDKEFRIGNLNGKEARCGLQKCLFPLLNYPHLGYLVTSHPDMEKGYNLTSIIEEHDMEHIYLGPPREISIGSSTLDWIKDNILPWEPHLRKNRPGKARNRLGFNSNRIYIQLVRVYSTSEAVLLGTSDSKFNASLQAIPEYLSYADPKVVRKEFAHFRKLLKAVPCLLFDLQMLVTREGRIVHLDLDRCKLRGKKFKQEYNRRLNTFEYTIRDQVRLASKSGVGPSI